MSAEVGNRADEGAGKADGTAEPTCLVSHPRSGPAMPAQRIEERSLSGKGERARGRAGQGDGRMSDEGKGRSERPEGQPIGHRACPAKVAHRGLDEHERSPRRYEKDCRRQSARHEENRGCPLDTGVGRAAVLLGCSLDRLPRPESGKLRFSRRLLSG